MADELYPHERFFRHHGRNVFVERMYPDGRRSIHDIDRREWFRDDHLYLQFDGDLPGGLGYDEQDVDSSSKTGTRTQVSVADWISNLKFEI